MSDIADLLVVIPYFAELSPELLDEIAEESEVVDVPDATVVIEEGDAADSMYVVLDGYLEVTKLNEGRQVVLNQVGPGEVVGEMGLLEDAPRGATVTATSESRLLRVPVAVFRELVEDPQFLLDLLKTVIRRLRSTEATLRHEERMAALGKMAAQLMHELNNPAAAVARSSKQLADVLATMGSASTSPSGEAPLSALDRADREEALGLWLDGLGVARPWELAAALTAGGYTADDLAGTEPDDVESVALSLMASQLAREVGIGAGRISELVRVVKEYSFVDQAPIQDVDVRSGIDDTLVLLGHKLRDFEVEVSYAEDLGTIEAPGRDLNQVWTNLIDNAADAMGPGDRLKIEARRDADQIVVNVTNTGEPIAADVLPRIFDPFFTTKAPGKGTGLGLHTVHSVLARMGGSIDARSDESGTAFTVRLPA